MSEEQGPYEPYVRSDSLKLLDQARALKKRVDNPPPLGRLKINSIYRVKGKENQAFLLRATGPHPLSQELIGYGFMIYPDREEPATISLYDLGEWINL